MRLDRQYAENKHCFDEIVERTLTHGGVLQGPEVSGLEAELASYFELNHAACVGSGTDALIIALRSLGLPDNSVIGVPDVSFIASASSIVNAGFIPFFVDVNGETGLADENQIVDLINKRRIQGFIAVHLYGQMMELSNIYDAAQREGMSVIEDAAQAVGAGRNGCSPGRYSDAVCVSFDPTKVIGAFGSGGAIITNRADIHERAKSLRYHGKGEDQDFVQTGYNSQMASLQAGFVSYKLGKEKEWRLKRAAIANRYNEVVEKHGSLEQVKILDGNTHNYHKYVLNVGEDRGSLMAHLDSRSISHKIHYTKPLHSYSCFKRYSQNIYDSYNSTQFVEKILSLPMYPEMEPDEVSCICAALADFM